MMPVKTGSARRGTCDGRQCGIVQITVAKHRLHTAFTDSNVRIDARMPAFSVIALLRPSSLRLVWSRELASSVQRTEIGVIFSMNTK